MAMLWAGVPILDQGSTVRAANACSRDVVARIEHECPAAGGFHVADAHVASVHVAAGNVAGVHVATAQVAVGHAPRPSASHSSQPGRSLYRAAVRCDVHVALLRGGKPAIA
eukprot:5862654-Prymnesium_polylepis.1